MRDFLWEGVDKGRGAHLVSWETMGKPMGVGKMELGNLKLKNKAMLAKWSWHFSLESTSL